MEKEELFEQFKKLKEEEKSEKERFEKEKNLPYRKAPLEREIIRDRFIKVKRYLEDRSDKIWGLGIKEFYSELSDEEIEDIFNTARHRSSNSPGYNPTDMTHRMRQVLESPTTNRKSRLRKYYKKFLYEKFSQEARDSKEVFEENEGNLRNKNKFNPSMTDPGIQFQLAFNDFFEPIMRKEDLEQKSNDLKSQLKELGKEFNKVNQDKSVPKDLRKKKGAEIQTNIHALKREVADYDEIEKAEKILSKNFILPNYPLEKLFKDLFKKFRDEHLGKE